MHQYKNILYTVIFSTLCGSCSKFLDKKSDQSLAVIETVDDCQALLDYYFRTNYCVPSSGEVSADNYYLTKGDWSALPGTSGESLRRMYVWEGEFLFERFPNDWSRCYDAVYYANLVLENLNRIGKTTRNAIQWDDVRGQALFTRAHAFWQAAVIWANAWDEATASSNPGIPLRLTSDFNERSERATVAETYDQITKDLKESVRLLPPLPVHVMRAGRAASYAMLARTYLSMRKYPLAGIYADSSLLLYNSLLDYNSLNPNATYPIPEFNKEIIFQNETGVPSALNNSRSKIDSILYLSYVQSDLRKTVFFKNNPDGTHGFKGSYDGQANLFSGLATDEVYLMRAEASARAGDITAAMNDLNTLLEHRWKKGTFVPLTASSPDDALEIVLRERRKELLFRCLRWMDLKRFNKEEKYRKTLQRNLDGQIIALFPDDPRYALPLPEDIIERSGMRQNPR